jgi:hypothetical protein
MDSFLLPLLSLAVGATLGLGSSILVSSIKQSQTVTLRLIDQFFEVRKEIVDVLSQLSDLDFNERFTDEQLKELQQGVSKLYYKHYDFLPSEVVESLLVLHACLKNRKGNLYQLKNGMVAPMSAKESQEFILQSSRFRNTRIFSAQAFKSSKTELRRNQAFKLHAQFVLYNLNKYVTKEKLLEMTKNLRKEWHHLKVFRQ